MKLLLTLWSIFGCAAVCLAHNCKPITEKQISKLASKDIFVPDDYCHIPGMGIYKLHEDLQTWNDARKICNDEGGRLAIITSQDEADALTEYLQESDVIHDGDEFLGAFLGFHDFYNEGEFVTILGQPLEETGYSKFSDDWGGQPDNGLVIGQGKGSQQCGALAHDGRLDDVRCSLEHGYFCQIPLTKKYF